MADNTSIRLETEIVIVGAGLVGLSAAVALTQLGRRVVMVDINSIDKTMPKNWDSRIYAVTEKTISWLKHLGIWAQLDPARINPISAMALFAPSLEPLHLAAEQAYCTQIGTIVESQHLIAACWRCLDSLEPTVLTGQISHLQLPITPHTTQTVSLQVAQHHIQAELIVGADGAHSWLRQQANINVAVKDFVQTALVSNYKTSTPHHDTAYQWFGAHETLAFLPMPEQQVSMVWALPEAEAQTMLQASPEQLAEYAASRAQQMLGVLSPNGPAFAFPLKQQTAQSIVKSGMVLMGDSAHQVHPMAGQGVNLGFKDVMTFCEHIATLSPYHSVGDIRWLKRYARSRKLDILAMHYLTSGLDYLFAQTQPWLQHASILGMRGIQNSGMLKRSLIKLANI